MVRPPPPSVGVVVGSGVAEKRLPVVTGAPEGWDAAMRERAVQRVRGGSQLVLRD